MTECDDKRMRYVLVGGVRKAVSRKKKDTKSYQI